MDNFYVKRVCQCVKSEFCFVLFYFILGDEPIREVYYYRKKIKMSRLITMCLFMSMKCILI